MGETVGLGTDRHPLGHHDRPLGHAKVGQTLV
jgi:hypothetical protein